MLRLLGYSLLFTTFAFLLTSCCAYGNIFCEIFESGAVAAAGGVIDYVAVVLATANIMM